MEETQRTHWDTRRLSVPFFVACPEGLHRSASRVIWRGFVRAVPLSGMMLVRDFATDAVDGGNAVVCQTAKRNSLVQFQLLVFAFPQRRWLSECSRVVSLRVPEET